MTTKEKELVKFGAHLRKLRVAKGISLHQLAATAALEYSQVQRIEKGKVNLTLISILALAEGLNISPDVLLKY